MTLTSKIKSLWTSCILRFQIRRKNKRIKNLEKVYHARPNRMFFVTPDLKFGMGIETLSNDLTFVSFFEYIRVMRFYAYRTSISYFQTRGRCKLPHEAIEHFSAVLTLYSNHALILEEENIIELHSLQRPASS